jgi:hypothetical protein
MTPTDELRNQLFDAVEEKEAVERQLNALKALTAEKEKQLSHAIEASLTERTSVLQERVVNSEASCFAAQSKAQELSKVLRVSQIRSEELLDENKR